MQTNLPVFKAWVPSWLIKVVVFLVILPSMSLFGLSTANVNAAAGYYGIEPADVQYSMVVFYAAVVGFYSLERRFFSFIAVKPYLLWGTLLQVITSYMCYKVNSLPALLVIRFVQGAANCATTSVCITLIFGNLQSERQREIGYSVFYGILLCITTFTTLVTAPLVDAFNYNVLYKALIFSYIPGTAILFIMLNNVRLSKKIPLYQLDWRSFVIYASALCLLGYILVYGQEYYWLHDSRILAATIALLALLGLHVLRQFWLRRPYLSLEVFKYTNFRVGALLIFILYICRGALGLVNSYFAVVLKLDPIHIAYVFMINMAGIVLACLISSRLIIMKRPMRFICMAGFFLLLIFHVWMRTLFTIQADISYFIIPLLLQGMGAGMLMTPIIVFMVSSVPARLGATASGTGVFFRFLGFCSSIASINYFSLAKTTAHYQRFLQSGSATDPNVVYRLAQYKQALTAKGLQPDIATKAAGGLLKNSINVQMQMRYMIDYYELISWMILAVLVVIAIYPYFNRTIIDLQSREPAPASY